jgi:hypothetical protein
MNPGAYLRYELLRTLRNKRFFFLALLFPVALYFLIAGSARHQQNIGGTGISAPLYFMVSLASFGTMTAMMSSGARIATERAAGWTRQLRISPLSPRSYFRTKVATAYLMALLTIAALYICGASLGVSMPAAKWLEVTGLILVALVPFAALGIVIGHLLNPRRDRPRDRRWHSAPGVRERHVVPDPGARLPARGGGVHAVVLAGTGEPDRGGRQGLGADGLAGCGRLGRRPDAARRPDLPPRQRPPLAVVGGRASRSRAGVR